MEITWIWKGSRKPSLVDVDVLWFHIGGAVGEHFACVVCKIQIANLFHTHVDNRKRLLVLFLATGPDLRFGIAIRKVFARWLTSRAGQQSHQSKSGGISNFEDNSKQKRINSVKGYDTFIWGGYFGNYRLEVDTKYSRHDVTTYLSTFLN